MLGIDVLEELNFSTIKGKRVGLLTHPAGVNNKGVSTIDVLRRAKNVKLVALYGPEHGIYGDEKANIPIENKIDKRTGLPVYSLYGKFRKPTPEMLSKIDVMIVDLQDVGCRSYTYVSCMIRTMEACFENGKDVVVLDRPNPLGGLKIDGPMHDMKYKSYVGMIKTPYVHGLTIGEIARIAASEAGWLELSKKKTGKLYVVPMKGWKRNMLWTDTKLKWVPTSPAIPNFDAVVGYAMTGLGCQIGGFQHGYGTDYPFRFLTYKDKTPAQIISALNAKKIPGLAFNPLTIKTKGGDKQGVYVKVTDFNALNPTEVSFYLMQIACVFSGKNVFAGVKNSDADLYNKHVGSEAWWKEISSKGRNANVPLFINNFKASCEKFRAWRAKYLIY